jgi:hypothetical protein
MTATVILGPEYDDALRAALLAVLRSMGAKFEPVEWAVAGSQEVVTRIATVSGKKLKLESETYVGLSLSGDVNMIEAIASSVRDRMTASGN